MQLSIRGRSPRVRPSLYYMAVSYNAGISACEKGEQWQRALALLSEMWEAQLEPYVISYSAGTSACERRLAVVKCVVVAGRVWERLVGARDIDAQ